MSAALTCIPDDLWLHSMPIVVPVERDMDGVVMRELVELTN